MSGLVRHRHHTRHTRTWLLALVAGLLLLATLETSAQEMARNLSGTVVDRRGNPLANAQVLFDGPTRYLSVTNSNGEFFIDEISPGRYQVTVTRNRQVQNFFVAIDGGINPGRLEVGW